MKTTKSEEKVTERRDVLKLAVAGVVVGGVTELSSLGFSRFLSYTVSQQLASNNLSLWAS